jgi:hypothetical protein
MAVAYTKPWNAALEKTVRDFYHTLSEKDRRRFAAVQARQLGYGGVRTVRLLNVAMKLSEPLIVAYGDVYWLFHTTT